MSDVRDAARRALGAKPDATAGSVAEAVWSGAGWRTLLVCGAVGGLILAQVALIVTVDVPSMAIGRSSALVYFLGVLCWSLSAMLAAPFALRFALHGRPPRPVVLATGTALLGAGYVGWASMSGLLSLCLASVVAGAGTMTAGVVHGALVADGFPPGTRVRTTAVLRAVTLSVAVLCGGCIALLPDLTAGSWRLGTGIVAVLSLLLALASLRLVDPCAGGQENDRVRWLVHGTADLPEPPKRRPGFAESLRRVLVTPSARPLLVLIALVAALTTALALYGAFALSELGGASTTVTWLTLLGAAMCAVVALPITAPSVEALASSDPAGLARVLGYTAVTAGAVLAPIGWLPLPAQAVAIALVALAAAFLAVAAEALLAAVVPPQLRGGAAVLVIGAAVLGGLSGPNLLSTGDNTWGLRIALVLAGVVVASIARLLRVIGANVAADHARAVEELVEREELYRARRDGAAIPLLSCRNVNFSYGPLQVLFDVDFSVDEGEMVALLGTNGAGKSTLLKVVSGVGLPSSGTVRLRGEDITYAEPGDRVRAGISQIPGGRAVFGPLTVAENLRLYGYALGRDRRAVERGIETAFATFPRLAERRNALASTMSGGEQQMLALTKAFILRPQLLLIDELSLGLAPKVVGELLDMVRQINATGAAVVLVEQSVNVALTLAHHAYFMEKGEVRFDGAASELLDRPDVLRSVFLEGAAKGLGE